MVQMPQSANKKMMPINLAAVANAKCEWVFSLQLQPGPFPCHNTKAFGYVVTE